MIKRNEGASSRRPNRRQVGAGLIAALATSGARAQDGTRVLEPRSYDAALIPAFSFEVIEIDARGRIGAMVRDHGTGRVADWAQDDTFPIASVYKLLLVARVLSRIDGGADRPDRTIAIGAEDVAGYAPVLGDRAGTSMTLDALRRRRHPERQRRGGHPAARDRGSGGTRGLVAGVGRRGHADRGRSTLDARDAGAPCRPAGAGRGVVA